MRVTSRAIAMLTLALTALPATRRAPLAQEIPGADTKAAGHLKAEYLAYVVAKVDTLMADWRSAWSSANHGDIAALYAENALLIPAGSEPITGREPIRRHYEEALQAPADIGVSLGDFAAGEEIAYQFGDYRAVDPSGDTSGQVFGRHVTIAMRYGRDWRIRAQLLLPAPDSRHPVSMAGAAANLEPLSADRLGPRTGQTGGGRTRFLQRVFAETSAVLATWRESWRRDDLAGAVEGFSEEAVLALPGEEPRFGRAAIRSRLRDFLPSIGDLHATILDFDASGDVSYVYGRYFCQCRSAHGGDVLGHYLSVLTADGSGWLIRALVLWTNGPEGQTG